VRAGGSRTDAFFILLRVMLAALAVHYAYKLNMASDQEREFVFLCVSVPLWLGVFVFFALQQIARFLLDFYCIPDGRPFAPIHPS
jgi:hypothetical protein